MTSITKISIVVILLAYVIFGLFILDIPSVKSDELWETSIAYYLKNHHHPGDPLLPKEVAPFFATIQELGWQSWFIGSLKSGTSAIVMGLVPVDPRIAVRLNGFLWSVSVCFFTFLFARKSGFDKWHALLAVAFLLALPEFFQQVHSYRAEIPIASLYLIGILMLMKGFNTQSARTKKVWLFLTGLYAWLPALFIHPSAIVIPATIGILFLFTERKKIFSINTLFIGLGLAGGLVFFFYIKGTMGNYTVSQGGTDFYNAHACPPIVCEGWRYVLKTPLVFYNKFVKSNAITQPVSFLIFAFAAGYLVWTIWKNRKVSSGGQDSFLLIAIVVPLILLLLLSSSYGNYNVIAAPFIAIALVKYFQRNLSGTLDNDSSMARIVLPILLIAVSASNVMGMKAQYAATREYKKINAELRKTIPADANVMGMALYYLPFRDQNYYSVTWFEPTVGKSDLSFESALRMKNINYVIVDDAFASRVNFRGKAWSDSLVNFLASHAELVDEFHPKMYLKIVPDSTLIPEQFRYSGFEKNYVKRIQVFRLKI